MSKNGMKGFTGGRGPWRAAPALLDGWMRAALSALGLSAPLAARKRMAPVLFAFCCLSISSAFAQQNVFWRSWGGKGGNWTQADGWYYQTWNNNQYGPDYTYKTANYVEIGNNDGTSMNLNDGRWYDVLTLTFASGASAAHSISDNGIDMRGSGAKIQNNSSGHHVFNSAIQLHQATEFNPVDGHLTFNGAIGGDYWINVWGNNGNILNIFGVKSGSGGISVKENSIVVLTNDNTFSGGLWVEKGTAQLANHTNAMGAGTISVGTNATLDLQHGTASLRPVALNLYNGQVTKSTGTNITYRGDLTSYNSSTVSVTDATLYFSGGFALSSGTLDFTNSVVAGMASGSSMTGSGTFAKNGSGVFRLYPGTHSGNISLNQGEIRQYTGTMTGSGTLTMAGGTKYSSDGASERTLTKALVINGNVGLAVNSTGGLVVTNTVGLGGGMRIVTNNNTVTFSGVMSNGGLAKAGAGTMVLSGANTYALGTLVSAGVLEGTTTSLQGNITNNSALTFNQAGAGTYAGVLSGTGALTNKGAGTVTLSGTSTLSGPTTIAAGTLLVSGAIGSSAVTVGSGATLAGAGTVGSIAALAGTVSPGASAGTAGTLTVNGAAALGGGAYTCDVTGTGSTACDKIEASGAVAAAAALTINLPASAPSGFSECTSYSWTIMSGSSASAANMSIGTKWASSGTFGVSASGNAIVVTHTPGTPAAPDNLAATDGTSTAQVALSWDDVSCETGFVVWRNTANNFAGATAIYTNAANATTYNDAAADAGQLYYYWVTATNAGGSSAASTVDSGYKRLTAPANVAATDGSSTATVAVTWDAATGASTYHVYRDTDATPAGATALGPQVSGFTDAPTAGQLYSYWVVASNSTSSSTSDWSTANTGYRKLATVTDVAATENLSDKVTVTWTDIAGETGYAIWRNTVDASGSAAIVGTAAADATSYDDTSADPDQDYYYWVRGTNSTSTSMGDFSASDYGYRILGEPSTAASNIVFGDLDTTS
ncbi:MAG: hypothetical protein EOL90_10300, partial [Spartobacteria bacterium]|nr:hypothetical protein [Spartobacteria bacterium]